MAKTGRPTKFSAKLAREICRRIEGGETLRHICREEGMPARSTINRWLADNESFQDQYARSKEVYNDDEFDGLDELDELLLTGKIDAAQHRTLTDSKKWRIAKRNPRKYGDKVGHEVTGRDGGPVEIICSWEDESPDSANGQG